MQITVNTMKQASHYLLLCVLIAASLTSCHKDIDESGESTTTQITQVDEENLTQGDVVGYIYDEQGQAMADVSVTILNSATQTNEYGVFVFRDINLDKNGTYVKATKGGFILGSDMLYPDRAEANFSYIKMLKLSSSTTVSGTNGGNIVVQGGGIITFPPNGFVNQDGAAHTGSVTVTAKRISADDPDLSDVMPGGLVAMDKEGYTRVLGTLGMVAVELRDVNGNEIELAEGVQATVQFPIASSQLEAAPDQIALWSFDEDRGLWIEEGFATREGNNYVGEVSHFSYWNCDAPFPLIHLCGTVLLPDGRPAVNMGVQVMADVIYSTGFGYTDSEGRFCGKMPKGEELKITVFFPGCEQEGYMITVGPFNTDTELDPITLPNVDNQGSGIITGTVYCDGDPLPNASIVVNIDGETIVYLANAAGMYNINTSSLVCQFEGPGSLFAFNNETNEASSSQEFSISQDATIDLNTCGGCDMTLSTTTGFVDPCDVSSYFAMVDVADANGSVTYSWSNGSTAEVIDDLESNIYCVTVTDAEGCEEVSCVELELTPLADSLLVSNSMCDLDNGIFDSNPYGGTAPYEYQLLDGGGNVISTSQVTDNLSAGSYTMVVTDANGCTVSTTETINEESGIPDYEIIQDCGITQFWISPNQGEYTITVDGVSSTNSAEIYNSGSYCFEVSNAQGCNEIICLDIEVFDYPDYNIQVDCDFPLYVLTWDNLAAFSIFSSSENDVTVTNQFSPSIGINPLEVGYSGILILEDDFSLCFYEEQITLPNYKGLDVVGNEASCADCEDGFLEIITDVDAECFDCTFGTVSIYDAINDPALVTDLSGINDAQMLPVGEYYVIVKDADSGCIIAHQKVSI